ncbi:PLC-like phosphodiesterase [Phialemonium atrogriseum]|uniref:PLC-like phosphodiesterase n=1 Tax=Phialemonium atrogriseum TaxID=1093897 RepID=A0AAJ0BQT9_9PEZI|nr:PLC-like phosphodiesterase [Phialemonium atrogriseum]KAK1762347.1 PLC-like phosphodiesterase [Phialemonium atrogriseum]
MRSSLGWLLAGLAGLKAVAAACNGNSALCSRIYSNITQVGAHDSAFVGILLPDNQYVSVAKQLDMGVRFLQAQTHKKDGGIEMCHTTCIELDAGSLSKYLGPIKTWLDGHPDEVVTLLLTNGDAIPVSQFGNVFSATGLDKYAYTPEGTLTLDQWPTLQAMIDSGNRLVVFMDYHSDTNSVPYILDEFAYFYETPFDTTDKNFPQCTLDRPAGAGADGRMGIVNHFLDVDILGILIPDRIHASTTNSVSSIVAQANLCLQNWGRLPNVVLLDWINEGDAIGAQNVLNHL